MERAYPELLYSEYSLGVSTFTIRQCREGLLLRQTLKKIVWFLWIHKWLLNGRDFFKENSLILINDCSIERIEKTPARPLQLPFISLNICSQMALYRVPLTPVVFIYIINESSLPTPNKLKKKEGWMQEKKSQVHSANFFTIYPPLQTKLTCEIHSSSNYFTKNCYLNIRLSKKNN